MKQKGHEIQVVFKKELLGSQFCVEDNLDWENIIMFFHLEYEIGLL